MVSITSQGGRSTKVKNIKRNWLLQSYLKGNFADFQPALYHFNRCGIMQMINFKLISPAPRVPCQNSTTHWFSVVQCIVVVAFFLKGQIVLAEQRIIQSVSWPPAMLLWSLKVCLTSGENGISPATVTEHIGSGRFTAWFTAHFAGCILHHNRSFSQQTFGLIIVWKNTSVTKSIHDGHIPSKTGNNFNN